MSPGGHCSTHQSVVPLVDGAARGHVVEAQVDSERMRSIRVPLTGVHVVGAGVNQERQREVPDSCKHRQNVTTRQGEILCC